METATKQTFAYKANALGKISSEKLQNMIEGFITLDGYGETINEQYNLKISATDVGTGFKISWNWIKGIIPGTRNEDPRYAKDAEPFFEDSYFYITRHETFDKLAKELREAIEMVLANPFDEYLEE